MIVGTEVGRLFQIVTGIARESDHANEETGAVEVNRFVTTAACQTGIIVIDTPVIRGVGKVNNYTILPSIWEMRL